MSREEARAILHAYLNVDLSEDEAIDALFKLTLDDASMERAAVALYVHNNPVGNWSAHSARVKTPYRDAARSVLAAAVEAGQ